jgi:preprotein translocase subunit SecE
VAQEKKRRTVKKAKPETVREKMAKASESEAKPRRIRSTASKARRPLKAVGKGVTLGARPFAFLLAPFKTRPARFVGRILVKVLFINYIRNSWRELKQVTWPTRRETIKLAVAVFIFATAFALLIAVVDFGLDKVFKALLLE